MSYTIILIIFLMMENNKKDRRGRRVNPHYFGSQKKQYTLYEEFLHIIKNEPKDDHYEPGILTQTINICKDTALSLYRKAGDVVSLLRKNVMSKSNKDKDQEAASKKTKNKAKKEKDKEKEKEKEKEKDTEKEDENRSKSKGSNGTLPLTKGKQFDVDNHDMNIMTNNEFTKADIVSSLSQNPVPASVLSNRNRSCDSSKKTVRWIDESFENESSDEEIDLTKISNNSMGPNNSNTGPIINLAVASIDDSIKIDDGFVAKQKNLSGERRKRRRRRGTS